MARCAGRLARRIQGECRLKLIEPQAARCEYLTTQLDSSVLVLHGDSDTRVPFGQSVLLYRALRDLGQYQHQR